MAKKISEIERRALVGNKIEEFAPDTHIPLQTIRIDDVQPHSIALAKTSLDYIIQNSQPGDQYFKPKPVVRLTQLEDGTLLDEDGDHRLYQIQQNGSDVYTHARVFDMSNPNHRKTLADYRRVKDNIGFLYQDNRNLELELTEIIIEKLGITRTAKTTQAYEEQLEKHNKKSQLHLDFTRSEGIYKPSDLVGKVTPDRDILEKEFNAGLIDYLDK